MTDLSRRQFVQWLAGASGAALVAGPGCGYFPAESGDAFSPWTFPDGEVRPEFAAARAALLAANPHNTQPWALRVTKSRIELHANFERNLGTMDGLRRELHIGLGCALENLALTARAFGRAPEVRLLPDGADPSLVATVDLSAAPPVDDPLFAAIPHRHTNRGRYADAPVASGLDAALRALLVEPGIQLTLLTTPTQKDRFRTGTIDATRAIIADPEMSRDTNRWYRHSAAEIEKFRDGVTLDTSGNGAATRFFGKIVGRPSDATSNQYWLDLTKGDHTTASAFCILSSPAGNAREDQLRAGRIHQRIHLWSASQGLALQPLNQMAERQDREEALGLTPVFTKILRGFVGEDRRAQMLFRIGYAWDEAFESPRRPLEWVLL
jgi:hypothetical protein